MVKIFLNNEEIGEIKSNSIERIAQFITEKTTLDSQDFYLVQQGKRLCPNPNDEANYEAKGNILCFLRIRGGKGGFGSMLRAIGAQIEKTTNREACRDLSGRRLRDINEEKRLKAWLDKQGERDREAEERKKRKIEKLLAVPKHEFKDDEYEETRSKLAEKVSDAVEKGFKKSQDKKNISEEDTKRAAMKRKGKSTATSNAKKIKSALWIGDDISDTDDSDGRSSDTSDSNEDRAEASANMKLKKTV